MATIFSLTVDRSTDYDTQAVGSGYGIGLTESDQGVLIPKPDGIWTWGSGNVWSLQNKCKKCVNNTNKRVKLTKVSVACNYCVCDEQWWPGYFWANDGQIFTRPHQTGTNYFHLYQQVIHTSENQTKYNLPYCQWGANQSGSKWDQAVASASHNMKWCGDGTATGHTANFEANDTRIYEFDKKDTSLPYIYPGDTLYIHMYIHGADIQKYNYSNGFIKIFMNDLSVEIEQDDPYVWIYDDLEGTKHTGINRWHLIEPVFIEAPDKGWMDIEGAE